MIVHTPYMWVAYMTELQRSGDTIKPFPRGYRDYSVWLYHGVDL